MAKHGPKKSNVQVAFEEFRDKELYNPDPFMKWDHKKNLANYKVSANVAAKCAILGIMKGEAMVFGKRAPSYYPFDRSTT